MGLRHPLTAAPAEAYEGLVFCLSALAAHYPNRYENEISGQFPWTFERLQDGRGGTMIRSRISIIQVQGRDAAKSWNFVDNSQYPLVALLSSYPASANFAIANSRDFLRLAIYFAKACVSHYPMQRLAVAYQDPDTRGAINDSVPFVNWSESQLADGRPYCVISCSLPLIAANDGSSSWAALNLASLATPVPSLLPAFTTVA